MTADNYIIASGAILNAGCNPAGGGSGGLGGLILSTDPIVAGDAMSLRPTPGNMKSIHLNTLSSLDPCPAGNCWYSESSKQNGPWTNWTGAIFASAYSAQGAMVYFGGGHMGYDGNEFYIFNLSNCRWERLNNPVDYDFLPDTSADWSDVLVNGSYVQPASHTYSNTVYIPPSLGGGNKGSFCNVYITYGGGAGSGNGANGFRPHAIDLETGVWTRLTDNYSAPAFSYGGYGGSFVDTTRGVIWSFAGTETSFAGKIDMTATPKHLVVQTTGGPGPIYAVPVYVPEKDVTVQVHIYDAHIIRLSIFSMNTGSPVGYAVTFTANQVASPGNPGMGIDYCPDTNKFYVYEGFGSTTLYVATPPSTDVATWTGNWTWSTETMGGEAPVSVLEVQPGALGAQVFNKWKYNRALKCFMWSQGTAVRVSPDGVSRNGAFQLYRPLGT